MIYTKSENIKQAEERSHQTSKNGLDTNGIRLHTFPKNYSMLHKCTIPRNTAPSLNKYIEFKWIVL